MLRPFFWTMREECRAARRCRSVDLGGDTSTQRTDPRAGGQEVMFLVTVSDTYPSSYILQMPRTNKLSLSSKAVRSEFSVIHKTKNPNSKVLYTSVPSHLSSGH